MKSTTMKRKKHLTSDLKELQFLSFSFICFFWGFFLFFFIAFSQWLSNWPGLVFFAIISRWRTAIVCVCFNGSHAVLFPLPLFFKLLNKAEEEEEGRGGKEASGLPRHCCGLTARRRDVKNRQTNTASGGRERE